MLKPLDKILSKSTEVSTFRLASRDKSRDRALAGIGSQFICFEHASSLDGLADGTMETVAKITETNEYLNTKEKRIDMIASSVSRSSAAERIEISEPEIKQHLLMREPKTENAMTRSLCLSISTT